MPHLLAMLMMPAMPIVTQPQAAHNITEILGTSQPLAAVTIGLDTIASIGASVAIFWKRDPGRASAWRVR